MADNILKLIASLFIFICVLALTYFTTRYIGKLQNIRTTKGNISIIEGQKLSANKGLYIVKIGQEYYALATGKDTVNVIGKLDSSGLLLPEENPESGKNMSSSSESFEKILEKFKIKKQDKE